MTSGSLYKLPPTLFQKQSPGVLPQKNQTFIRNLSMFRAMWRTNLVLPNRYHEIPENT